MCKRRLKGSPVLGVVQSHGGQISDNPYPSDISAEWKTWTACSFKFTTCMHTHMRIYCTPTQHNICTYRFIVCCLKCTRLGQCLHGGVLLHTFILHQFPSHPPQPAPDHQPLLGKRGTHIPVCVKFSRSVESNPNHLCIKMYNIACKIKSWWTSWIQSLNQIFVCNALFMYLHSLLYVLGHGWGPYGEVLWRLSLTAPPSPLPSPPPPLIPGSWAPCWKPLRLTSVTCSRYRGWGRWGRSGSKAGDGSKTMWRSWCYSDCLVLLCGEGLWSSCVGKLGRERPGN